MSIVLHIERLVLDESLLGKERPVAVRMAIERELRQQLARPGATVRLRDIGTVAELPATALPAADHARERLGPRIATAVSNSLGVATHTRTSR